MQNAQALLNLFRPGMTTRVSDLAVSGQSRATLYRSLKTLESEGRIVRVRHGAYRLPDNRDEADGWMLAMDRYPAGVLCLLSALMFHQLTTQVASAVWLALPRGAWRNPPDYPRIRFVHFSGDAHQAGIELHDRPDGQIRVYSAAKTVADCFKLRGTVGLEVAIEALREGWRERRFTLDELNRMAKICRVQKVIAPYVEAMIS